MKYALINDEIVSNIIWLNPKNTDDFPDAVPMDDYPVRVGDTYVDGVFYRDGEPLKTMTEMAQEEMTDMQEALNILGVTVDE